NKRYQNCKEFIEAIERISEAKKVVEKSEDKPFSKEILRLNHIGDEKIVRGELAKKTYDFVKKVYLSNKKLIVGVSGAIALIVLIIFVSVYLFLIKGGGEKGNIYPLETKMESNEKEGNIIGSNPLTIPRDADVEVETPEAQVAGNSTVKIAEAGSDEKKAKKKIEEEKLSSKTTLKKQPRPIQKKDQKTKKKGSNIFTAFPE
ncbi:MAG: hypothetical protein NC907_05880, partial [Candidatus Omnitrophica bacterium]|nr:hypothetical protein [Candidatus Omnitrophota bacterium]